jgi:hypothetical protein
MVNILTCLFRRQPVEQPTTCSDAGRLGNMVKRDRHRARVRAKTLELARKYGAPGLVARVEGLE